jgi:hypothetical protein
MDDLNPEVAKILAAKEARRRRLALARFPDKIAALVRLQEMAAPIQRSKGLEVWPWRPGSTVTGKRVNAETAASQSDEPSE